MSLVLAVHFRGGIFEYFLPGLNNRRTMVEIPSASTGLEQSVALSLEVWNGVWRICPTDEIEFVKDVASRPYVELEKGLTITCEHRTLRERFSVIVDENYDGYSEFQYFRLTHTIRIGREVENDIVYDNRNRVSGVHATIERAPDGSCTLTDNRSSNGTFVNGKKINGTTPLHFGDVVYIIGLKIVYLEDLIAVNRASESQVIRGLEPFVPPAFRSEDLRDAEEEYYRRTPRQLDAIDDEMIEIEAPPAPARSRRQPLIFTVGPAMTMIIPMASGILFTMWSMRQSGNATTSPFMFMGIITSVTAAFIGVFWALMNYRYSKKTEREDELRRSSLYRNYLEKMRKLLTQKHIDNQEILTRIYPDASTCLSYPATNNRRLWERNVNHPDFLTVRLGKGEIPSPNEVSVPKERFSLIDDQLGEEPRNIQAEYRRLKDAPITISLRDHSLIGVLGSAEATFRIGTILAAQIAAYHAYTDVRMAFVYDEPSPMFEFARWLPHTWSEDGGLRMIACDANGVGELFYELSAVLRERTEEREGAEKERPLPHYVLFLASPSLVENEGVMKYLLSPTPEMGITTVLLYGQIDRLPNSCNVVIQNDAEYRGYYSMDNRSARFRDVSFDFVDPRQLESFARQLSGVRLREMHIAGAPPQMLTFLEMYRATQVEEIDVERRWLENRTYESLKAMIGFRGPDTPLYLDIHEKYHGPHGLVAGTTGSGKSETLQTYILSLALNYHPHEVSFILIDYKGGGMAGSFERLPHIAGIITNLGGNQTNRALASINSEIKRRQAMFQEHKLKHIDEYIELYRGGKVDQPIPHLLIIADEFAELKKEQPEFVRELVSASRVGRSLGVHLILATQKPSGVVDDEIWSNSKFRLCLRVQDKQDSNEMIRRPDAAYITNAGRGFFQVGSDEIFETFQSGWSGAKYDPEVSASAWKREDAKMINLLGRPSVLTHAKKRSGAQGEGKRTQLEIVVSHIVSTAEALRIRSIDTIWLPPLASRVAITELREYAERAFAGAYIAPFGELNPVIGIADDPVNQRQKTVSIDFLTEGHLMITGSGASGKTTFLQTLLYSLATTYSPAQLQLYISDFGSRTMGVFGALPHTGGVVFDDEKDKASKLVGLLLRELARRKLAFSEKGIGSIREYARLYEDVPFLLFVIDNYASWNENCPHLEDAMVQLSREAASYGIYLVLTASNAGDVRNKIRQNINFGIGLQLADRFEYEEAINAKIDMLAEDHIPGRGLICTPNPLEFQTAIYDIAADAVSMNRRIKEEFEAIAASWNGVAAPAIPEVPKDLTVRSLLERPDFGGLAGGGRHLPYAYDLAEAKVEAADLARLFCFSISGTPRSGKTNLLRVLMRVAKRQDAMIVVFDGSAHELERDAKSLDALYLSAPDELFDFFQKTMIPEFQRRNLRKKEFKDSGSTDLDAYLAGDRKIFFFVHDMTAFCEAVYNNDRDMKGFVEVMMDKGEGHLVYLIAVVTSADLAGQYGSKKLLRGFIQRKEGIHLGGKVEDQRIFDFDVPILERGKKLASGLGHVASDRGTLRVITPIVE
ncbi:MAG: type VII secretion protein EssC [Bacillota bacterium]|nr:type VII secretion protein EssC [Bacillota bacterium]